MSDGHERLRASPERDRRFLPRSEPGRRATDRAKTELLPVDNDDALPRATPSTYLFILVATLVIGVVSVRSLNAQFAPLLYSDRHIWNVGEILSSGKTYLTYDLNIETRGLRRESIRNLKARPDLVVMGASHWQEADGALMPSIDFYNAHVHRDYYEDIVTVAGWFFVFDRMPKKMVISIRDNQFTPVHLRTDYLWVPILPDYREIAPVFGLKPHNAYANGLTPRMRAAVSLPSLATNIERYLDAPVLPHSSDRHLHETLDVLLPDGGIYWSDKHRRSFTRERTRKEALNLAAQKIGSPPVIDPDGVLALDRVLAFLIDHDVEVFLAHPPYNPDFWDAVQGTRYLPALSKVEKTVASLADKYGIEVIGGFDPSDVGCTSDMYIDGEHSNPVCLGLVLIETLDDQGTRIASTGTPNQ